MADSPAPHLKHVALAISGCTKPVGHAVHSSFPPILNNPAEQSVQTARVVAPDSSPILPGGQSMQLSTEEDDIAVTYLPATQC